MTTKLEINERQFLRQVTDLAKVYGWATYHTQLSKWSESGWPDLALVRPPRLILAELKSERGRLTESQRCWLEQLQACPGIEVYLWRPHDLDEIARILSRHIGEAFASLYRPARSLQ